MQVDGGPSADGAISAVIALVAFVVLTLGVIHEVRFLKERYSAIPLIGRFIDRAETLREWTIRAITVLHRVRYVALFVLAAMFVSTISPVSSLLEVEDGILQNACGNLADTDSLGPDVSFSECKARATAGSTAYFERSLEATKNHFLQVALWPFTATIYGFGIALFFRIARRDVDQPLEEVIELFPHVHHIITGIFVMLSALVGYVQDLIGG